MSSLTLGITTVGDLLLENKISQTRGTKDLKVKLSIPNYQRPYKWTSKNVIRLLDDIIEAKNQNKEIYRVGTLILHNTNNNEYDIVDGQQRTITFSLLLNILIKKCNLEGQIELLNQSVSNNNSNRVNLQTNFRTLKQRIQKLSENESEALYNYIFKCCELIVVITEDLSEAFQFFDSQNARGKELYPHDLLKAYHLREMNTLDVGTVEQTVKTWEDLNQEDLSSLFSNYLHRIKEWTRNNYANHLTSQNIQTFKGVTHKDNYPYAQFYKGAFSYAEMINNSPLPFVTGIQNLRPFQINAPIIAGKPFFDYAKYYFDILKDIQNNDKYSGYYINGNEIVEVLDSPEYRQGVGNNICRLLFDCAILLYVDRFCPPQPTIKDNEILDQFVIYAFIWAYSLRAQYHNIGWKTAQNYIMSNNSVRNSTNIYKHICEADSPTTLFNILADTLKPLIGVSIAKNQGEKDYLEFFKKYNFYTKSENNNQD